MREIFKSFLLSIFFVVALPVFLYADDGNENIDVATNMSLIKNNINMVGDEPADYDDLDARRESIAMNEEEFNKVAEQVRQRYPDFDWSTFDTLDSFAKRIVLKNYLAGLAFDEVKKNYIKDIRARAKDGVTVEQDANLSQITYFNKSDAKYRTEYITSQMINEKARQRNILHSYSVTDSWSLEYVKQKDVHILDEILAQEVANAPVDMHCEKYCYDTGHQKNLSELKNRIEEYQQIQKQYLSDMRKNGAPRKEIREQRKKMADEIRELERQYSRLEKNVGIFGVSIDPYTETCELVTASCWNVEQIPQNYERFDLYMYDGQGITSIQYGYDDMSNNTHTEADAWRSSTCELDTKDVNTFLHCNISISFFDEIQDFAAVRNWENQDRVDIKNGKMQDRDENGVYKHEWAGNIIPGGQVVGLTTELTGIYEKSVTK